MGQRLVGEICMLHCITLQYNYSQISVPYVEINNQAKYIPVVMYG